MRDMSVDDIASSSQFCFERLMETSFYKESRVICCFLSMPVEIQTYGFLNKALSSGKSIFIPKVTGPRPQDMVTLELKSFSDILTFPVSKWGIPEPPEDYSSPLNPESYNVFDLIIVPGVAFDRNCKRLGHGRGYYGLK